MSAAGAGSTRSATSAAYAIRVVFLLLQLFAILGFGWIYLHRLPPKPSAARDLQAGHKLVRDDLHQSDLDALVGRRLGRDVVQGERIDDDALVSADAASVPASAASSSGVAASTSASAMLERRCDSRCTITVTVDRAPGSAETDALAQAAQALSAASPLGGRQAHALP